MTSGTSDCVEGNEQKESGSSTGLASEVAPGILGTHGGPSLTQRGHVTGMTDEAHVATATVERLEHVEPKAVKVSPSGASASGSERLVGQCVQGRMLVDRFAG